MNNKPINLLTILPLTFFILCIACVKQSDLNKAPDSSLDLLNSVEDAQALLDNMYVMQETPSLSEISSDNFYIPDSGIFNKVELNAYLWKDDIFAGQKLAADWYLPYQQVYYANSVLDAIPEITTKKKEQLNHIKGAAYFIRAYAFHNVAQEFSNLYDKSTAMKDAGIPLRLSADPQATVLRATVAQTYQQIVNDVKEAARWLPASPDPLRKNRPSVPAAYALLARVYLSMSDYANAKLYADSCLMLYTTLLDYNSIDTTMAFAFTANNEEVLYQTNLNSKTTMFYPNNCFIDSVLYRSYETQDLRKSLFFSIDNTGLPVPRYSYSGNITRFSGLAMDEVLLIRAESNARLHNVSEAIKDLSTLLKSRWKNGTYTPPIINTEEEALQLILTERRKELVFRGTRLVDIRRLNKHGAGITLHRWFRQTTYELLPGSNKFLLPIPPDVIAFNNEIKQNPR